MTKPYKITHITNYTLDMRGRILYGCFGRPITLFVNGMPLEDSEYTFGKRGELIIYTPLKIGSEIGYKNMETDIILTLEVVENDQTL